MKSWYVANAVLLLLSVMAGRSQAPDENPRFDHLTIEEGLPHNKVISILQDRKGLLWFATYNGLSKYDGYNITTYKQIAHDSSAISTNQMLEIFEDKEGMLWIGTTAGICKFNKDTETFACYGLDSLSLQQAAIEHLNEDKEGTIWVSSRGNELRQFNKQTGRYSRTNYWDLLTANSDTGKVKATLIGDIYKDRAGTLWIGTEIGLFRLNLQTKSAGKRSQVSLTHYLYNPKDPANFLENSATSIYEDKAGALWIASFGGGLNKFDRGTGAFTRYKHDPSNPHSIPGNFVLNIAEDGQGNLWMGTVNDQNALSGRLTRFNKDRTQFTSYGHDSMDRASLSNDRIISLLVDKSGVLWAGTDFSGINKMNLVQKPFTLYQHSPFDSHSLSNNRVYAITEDAHGRLWIGTEDGLNRFDKQSGGFIRYKFNVKGSYAGQIVNYVFAAFKDRDGKLWVGNGPALLLFDEKTESFINYSALYQGLGGYDIITLYQDRQGLLWLGTTNGVKSFDRKTGKVVHYPHDPKNPNGISDYYVYAILEDNRGNLWIGCGSIALNRLDRKSGKFTHYKTNNRDPRSIASINVQDIYQDTEGKLWFGTRGGGLCRFDYATETFETFGESEGLPDNSVHAIEEDADGNLWLGTNKGLSRFSFARRSFTNFDFNDGLQSNQFSITLWSGGHTKGSDGTLYFGGINGFNAFNPREFKLNSYIPPVVITQFNLFNKPLAGKNEAKEIVLNYNQNFFSFEFAALNYTNPQKNQYAYQLVGVDKDWVHSGTRRIASYTNVGPGSYIFRVKASNNDGVWNERGTSIRIVIQPPWWRTWWAYAFYGLCFIAGVLAVHQYQKRRLIHRERERAREKELVQAREIEKAYNKLRSTQAQLIQSEKMASLGALTAGIAHEIQNPLNFINNFSDVNTELIDDLKSELQSDNKQEALSIADDIKENELKISHHGRRADAIVKNMLQHSRASKGEKQLTDLNALVDEYLRLSYHGFRAKDKAFNAITKTHFNERIEKISIVPQDIGRVLLNLFNNAFYAVHEKGKTLGDGYEPIVSVSTKKLDGKIEIRVKDNGMGISKSMMDKIFQPFFTTKPTGQGTGLGLSLSYDIVKAHGGELNVESKEGEGAEFIIQFPLQNG